MNRNELFKRLSSYFIEKYEIYYFSNFIISIVSEIIYNDVALNVDMDEVKRQGLSYLINITKCNKFLNELLNRLVDYDTDSAIKYFENKCADSTIDELMVMFNYYSFTTIQCANIVKENLYIKGVTEPLNEMKHLSTKYFKMAEHKLIHYFDSISIRGRVAFGIKCLEKVCIEWNVKGREVDNLLELLWNYTSALALDYWENEISSEVNEENFWEYAIKFNFAFLPHEKQYALSNIIHDVIYIATSNLYSGYESKCSMYPTLRVVDILESNNIAIPDLKPFMMSLSSEHHGWGNRVPKSFFD